jgi:CheY-like chemotaxis protein
MNDAAELLETMRFVLQDAGYRVTMLAEALSDVRKLAEYRPDLIILDWLFHGQSRGGLEVVQAIRLTPEIKDLPLIVCTAAIREVREMAVYLQLQGVTVLYKPFDSTVSPGGGTGAGHGPALARHRRLSAGGRRSHASTAHPRRKAQTQAA